MGLLAIDIAVEVDLGDGQVIRRSRDGVPRPQVRRSMTAAPPVWLITTRDIVTP